MKISNTHQTPCPYCGYKGDFELVEEHYANDIKNKYFFLRCGKSDCQKFLSDVRSPEKNGLSQDLNIKGFREFKQIK